jgi:PA14 domain
MVVRGRCTMVAVLVHAVACSEGNPAYVIKLASDAAVPTVADAAASDTAVDAAKLEALPAEAPAADQPGAADASADAAADVRSDSPADTLALDSLPDARPMGTGLRGDYFDGVALEAGVTGTLDLRRVDATIDFDWGTGRPSLAVDDDYFSVRWTGQLMALFSEPYTFTTQIDEGVRLWVNGALLIDQWMTRTALSQSTPIPLVAGRRYDIKMEYFEGTGPAMAKLYWRSTSQPMEIVPAACLFPP